MKIASKGTSLTTCNCDFWWVRYFSINFKSQLTSCIKKIPDTELVKDVHHLDLETVDKHE